MKDLWVPLSGALAQEKRVESIANNVANANTPAFKRDQVVFKEYLSAYERGSAIDLPRKEWSPQDFYKTYGAEKANVSVEGSYTDFKQGQITPTQNPFDIALEGEGMFEVLTPNGIRYSRKGNLSLNGKSELVTSEGYPILSSVENSESLKDPSQIPPAQERIITLEKTPFSINQKGEIFQKGLLAFQLSLVEFKNKEKILKEGNSLFINKDFQNLKRDELTTVIHQGALEMSNVNPIQEMSKLIQAHRQLESIQRVIKTYDNMAGKAYNDIAKF